MIDDRMEEGLAEGEAVSDMGTVEEIVAQVIADTPFTKIIREKMMPKRTLRTWERVLLIVGSPIWGCLLIAVFAVVLALYAALWSVLVSLWAVFAAVAAYGLGGIGGGAVLVCRGHVLPGIAMIGAGLVCSGLSILLFFGCKAATKGAVLLTQKIASGMKNCLIRKEEA
jgi:uncharacterized membrane protein